MTIRYSSLRRVADKVVHPDNFDLRGGVAALLILQDLATRALQRLIHKLLVLFQLLLKSFNFGLLLLELLLVLFFGLKLSNSSFFS